MKKYTMNEMVHLTKNMLNERGVAIEDIALIVQKLQEKYHPDLPLDVCIENVEKVLNKREIVHAVLTGIALDQLAEKKLLPEPLQYLVETGRTPLRDRRDYPAIDRKRLRFDRLDELRLSG